MKDLSELLGLWGKKSYTIENVPKRDTFDDKHHNLFLLGLEAVQSKLMMKQ
jgi:hypothetical protein